MKWRPSLSTIRSPTVTRATWRHVLFLGKKWAPEVPIVIKRLALGVHTPEPLGPSPTS